MPTLLAIRTGNDLPPNTDRPTRDGEALLVLGEVLVGPGDQHQLEDDGRDLDDDQQELQQI